MEDIKKALIAHDKPALLDIVQRLLATENSSLIMERYLGPALESIGEGWLKGTYSMFQLYMSSRMCDELIDELIPEAKRIRSRPRLAVAVLNDFHPLGKKMVASDLRAAGFNVKDYGTGCSVEELVRRSEEDGIDVLLISTLTLPSALNVKRVRRGLDERGLRTKVIVGGSPFLFDQDLWKEVGADLMGRHSAEAASLVKRLEGGL